MADLIL